MNEYFKMFTINLVAIFFITILLMQINFWFGAFIYMTIWKITTDLENEFWVGRVK